MKAEQLREYIAKLVREEVKKAVREEVKNCITEAFGASSGVSNEVAPRQQTKPNYTPSYASLFENNESAPVVSTPPTDKKKTQYTKNPILNAVLNETAQNFKAIPPEGSMVGLIGSFGDNTSETINEVAAPKVPESAPVEVKKTAAVFNRDFRALMKSVDKKNAAKRGVDLK